MNLNKEELISDGTYLVYLSFINDILPKFFLKNLSNKAKIVYIAIENLEDGVYVDGINLGRIDYKEFVSYLYKLPSYKGFKLDLANILNSFNAPFNLKELYKDYYDELQKDLYFTLSKNTKKLHKDLVVLSLEERTKLAFDNFKEVLIKDIIVDTEKGLYRVDEVLDYDMFTSLTRILYLPIKIINQNLWIGKYNLGDINIPLFLEYLREMPGFIIMENQEFDLCTVTFYLDILISEYLNIATR